MAQTCEVIKMDQTGEAARKRAERLVAAPVLDKGWSIEYSQHRLLAGTMEDARVTFEHDLNRILDEKGIKLPSERKTYLLENMLAVPTWQPSPTWKELAGGDWQSANLDLSLYPNMSATLDLSLYPNMEVNKVRKQLYNKIVLWGAAMREAVAKRGYWADLACPITGNCMFGERTAHVYNELDGLTMMLGVYTELDGLTMMLG
ncbi:hypothetical protein T484DRAFT_1780393 [Baffinella frigidus]|nr:hypothetical protein T484DRAFT_1780393 [Cryptophyta sp. CCMP2293]